MDSAFGCLLVTVTTHQPVQGHQSCIKQECILGSEGRAGFSYNAAGGEAALETRLYRFESLPSHALVPPIGGCISRGCLLQEVRAEVCRKISVNPRHALMSVPYPRTDACQMVTSRNASVHIVRDVCVHFEIWRPIKDFAEGLWIFADPIYVRLHVEI